MRLNNRVVGCVFSVLASVGGWAQTTDRVPLKNWAAPIYWQPSRAAEISAAEAAGSARTLSPELSASGTGTVSVFVAITPCRLVDTRSNMPLPYGAGSSTPLVWTPGSQHSVPATGLASGTYTTSNPCVGLPVAQAYSANITVWPQSPTTTSNKWLSVCPTGTTTLICSATAALTWYESGTAGTAASIVANANVIPANSSGSFDVYVTDNTWVIVDINGYYISPSALTLGSGAAATPSLAFGSDTTSGLYAPSAGTIAIAASGTNVATLNSGGISIVGNVNLSGNLQFAQNNVLRTPGGVAACSGPSNCQNLAMGIGALQNNTAGYVNTAGGYASLQSNTIGNSNSAFGDQALQNNTTGSSNSAFGANALLLNTTGNSNTAVGNGALNNNIAGQANTAVGYTALALNTSGGSTAVGYAALWQATTSGSNIGLGNAAGYNLTTGSGNILIGNGHATTTGNNNIYLGNAGAATENGAIRIGDPNNQSSFFAAGIRGVTTGLSNAVNVVVDGNGQLGTVNSSRRFKEDIQDMGNASDGLMKLRPVTYRYKQPYSDGSKPIDYGLIAEEVEEVYPDLVVHSADGQVQTVQYQKVNAMLLNEVQKQRRIIEQQQRALDDLQNRLAALETAAPAHR